MKLATSVLVILSFDVLAQSRGGESSQPNDGGVFGMAIVLLFVGLSLAESISKHGLVNGLLKSPVLSAIAGYASMVLGGVGVMMIFHHSGMLEGFFALAILIAVFIYFIGKIRNNDASR